MASTVSEEQSSSSRKTLCGVDIGYTNLNIVVAFEDDVIVGSDDEFLDSTHLQFKHDVALFLSKAVMGRKFSDPELQSELPTLLFSMTEDTDGFPLLHFPIGPNKEMTCNPTQFACMSLSDMHGYNVSDCCIGVPVYFTYQERKELLAAATLARLIPRRILHETTAAALAYRFTDTNLPKIGELFNMAFIDVGYLSMQVSVIELKRDQLKVLSHAHDKSLGSRAFEQVLKEYIVAELKLDASQMWPSLIMKLARSGEESNLMTLIESCENLKNELSRTNKAELMHVDEKVIVTRAQFEKLSSKLLRKVKVVLQKAMSEARLATQDVHSVQILGGGSRMPAIRNIVKDFFKKELEFSMIKRDAIATGNLIQCAMLCSAPKLPTFKIIDILPYSIGLSWKREDGTVIDPVVVFPKGSPFPSVQDVTIHPGIELQSLDLISINTDHSLSKISTYMMKASENEEMKVKVQLDLHGMVHIESMIVEGIEGRFFETPHDERQATLRDKIEKVEKELADVSTQLSNSLIAETSRRIEVEELKKLLETTRKQTKVVEFSLSELKNATNNFDNKLKIGEGGFGCVYKGFLRYTTVAIKILNLESYQGDIEFDFNREVAILTSVRHPNIVSLIGTSLEARALIYEFLPNGSLDAYLTNDKASRRKLSWQNRLRIASEICSALIFLHSVGQHGIVHGDLKPENILLDSGYVTKIIDFGISREMQKIDKRTTLIHSTKFPKFTGPYADPDFLSSYELTPQYDIYSFGIIILQLVTGTGPERIMDRVDEAIEFNELDKVVDDFPDKWPIDVARKLAILGLRCSTQSRRKRPDLARDVWPEIMSMKDAAGL